MEIIYKALYRSLEGPAKRTLLKLPDMTKLDSNHKSAGSRTQRITTTGIMPTSVRNYVPGATEVSGHAEPAGLAVAVRENIMRRTPDPESTLSDFKRQFDRLSTMARLLERPGFQAICDRLGVAAVSLEKGKAEAYAVLHGSPDDLAARSEEMQEEGLIGVRFVEVTDSQPNSRERLDYLADGTVPVYNDGITSVGEILPWCALSPKTAEGVCAMAKIVNDPEQWEDPAQARATFMGRLEYLSMDGIVDIAAYGAESAAAKKISANTLTDDGVRYDRVSVAKVVSGVQGQLGPIAVAG